ncbi:trimethyllysine dioxygenase [Poronia punctata]|nr:trimethyllysine dioxygenase [Poronia punctata]
MAEVRHSPMIHPIKVDNVDDAAYSLFLIQYRDNCRCSTCVNQQTRQRNFNTFDIAQDIQPSSMKADESGLTIQWSNDSHESVYAWDFLEPYIKGSRPGPEDIQFEYFGADGHRDARISYSDVINNKENALGRLTDMIRRKGFAFVTDVPTESAKPTEQVLRKIAFIRETHYGGFYDFIPDLALADTAYTNLALAAHTDNTYFTDPSGLQAFHLLSHTQTGTKAAANNNIDNLGGQSLLVDGFHAASTLKSEEPGYFRILSSVGLPWHASGNEGITISPDRLYPVIELDDDSDDEKIHRIRWNNDDRGVVPLGEEGKGKGKGKGREKFSASEWYEAARKWDEILRRRDMEFWVQLEPGNVLIFDNWRVLHGRSAFTGVRRICGGYINRDDFISRWRNTNYQRDEISKRVIG